MGITSVRRLKFDLLAFVRRYEHCWWTLTVCDAYRIYLKECGKMIYPKIGKWYIKKMSFKIIAMIMCHSSDNA